MDKLTAKHALIYNVGLGKAYSVREFIEAAMHVTGKKIKVEIAPRREGDPSTLYCDSEKIRTELGWVPDYANLTEALTTAWHWQLRHPDGYES